MNINVSLDILDALEKSMKDSKADSIKSVIRDCVANLDSILLSLQTSTAESSKAITNSINEMKKAASVYFSQKVQKYQLSCSVEMLYLINVDINPFFCDRIEFIKVAIVYTLHQKGYLADMQTEPVKEEPKLVPNKGDYVPSFGVSADVKEALNSYIAKSKSSMRSVITDFVVQLGSIIATTTKENQDLGGDVVKNMVIRKFKDIKQITNKFMVSKRFEHPIDFTINLDSLISSDYAFYFTQNDFCRMAIIYGLYDKGYLPKLNLESLKPINNQYSGAVSTPAEALKKTPDISRPSVEEKKFKYLADGLEKDLSTLISDYIAMNEDKLKSKKMAITTFNRIIEKI